MQILNIHLCNLYDIYIYIKFHQNVFDTETSDKYRKM